MKKNLFLTIFTWMMIIIPVNAIAPHENPEDDRPTSTDRYNQMQRNLAKGWNTWDTRSVLTHVLLPYGVAIDLNLMDSDGQRANTFRIGEYPLMHPGPHTYDGAYTDISLEWNGHRVRVQSAADGLTNVILITPNEGNKAGGRLFVVPKTLWRRSNKITIDKNRFTFEPESFDLKIPVVVEGDFIEEKDKEIIMSADKPVIICCGENMTIAQAEKYIQSHAETHIRQNKEKYKEDYELYNAMQSVLAWDNIYDPTLRKVITPVSRIWNVNWTDHPEFGGYVLFCWDTYFASMMLSTGNKELAYANAVEITNSLTEKGFIPNFYSGNDFKSRDRSQPPVGSLAAWYIYKEYGEKWFLELLYDKLLIWNRWWDKSRKLNGLLCWGSDPFDKVTYYLGESWAVNEHQGGAFESGLDNSPMYDNIVFDKEKHLLLLNDVGLSALYVMDCQLLAKIADELGHKKDAEELRERGKTYSNNFEPLWDKSRGFYYNRHTDTGLLSPRISPTNFYPMLAKIPTQQQAERMMKEHFLNPEEFWGEWIIPATPRNDPAFKDNVYWRGRIWAPLNFLTYLGLCNYDLPTEKKALSEKSKNLLLKSWISNGYVFENYNSETGVGDDVHNSDKFYHWGALLGFITLMEDGYCHPVKE
jgi:hypothetical protein